MDTYKINFKQYSKTVRFAGRILKKCITTQNKQVLGKQIKTELVTMGPVYIKVGQIISTRTDIFPSYIIESLSELQNDVDKMPYEDVEQIFYEDFGKNLSYYFKEFSDEPIAAASIGQVHTAYLKNNNTKLAVKVLRKNIRETFHVELDVIMNILSLIVFICPNSKQVNDILVILKEIHNNVDSETNMLHEQKNMIVFRELLKDNENVLVPRVYKPLCSQQILVMEYIYSIKITECVDFHDEFLANELMKAFVKMVLDYGYIHCDPHPGNIGINDDKIILYDYGMVKKFNVNIREYFKKIFFALMNQSTEELVEFMLKSKIIIPTQSYATTVDMLTGYEIIVLERLFDYIYKYLSNLDTNEFIHSVNNDAFIDVTDIPFSFDTQLIYIFKSFSTLEGVCKQVYSNFNYIDLMSKLMVDFLDVDMIIDKVTYDIRKSSPQRVSNVNYTKLSIEKMKKQLENQNRNMIIMFIIMGLIAFL